MFSKNVLLSFAVGAAVASLVWFVQPGVHTPFVNFNHMPGMQAPLPDDPVADDDEESALPQLPAPPAIAVIVYDSRQPGWQDATAQFRDYAYEKLDELEGAVPWQFVGIDVAKHPDAAKMIAKDNAPGLTADRLAALKTPYVVVLEGDSANPDGDAISAAVFPYQEGKLDNEALDELFKSMLDQRQA